MKVFGLKTMVSVLALASAAPLLAQSQSTVTQSGASNLSVVNQGPTDFPADNMATVDQQGSNNQSFITQETDLNTATVNQLSDGNISSITQTGTGNTATVNQ